MYKEEELKKKIQGHLSKKEQERVDSGLLGALISDVDEFNKNTTDSEGVVTEIYIDFDDIGNGGSEGDPYETFSLRIKKRDVDEHGPNICDGLSLDGLDTALYSLCSYVDERKEIVDPIKKDLKAQNDALLEKIQEETKKGNIVFKEMDRIMGTSFTNFTSQGIDGQLYDLNRGPEVITKFKDEDWSMFTQRWINDLALVNLLKYYVEKCSNLEHQLTATENKLIEKDIIK